MKRIFLIAFLILTRIVLNAQMLTPTVISSGGGSYQNNYAFMDVTIGEPVTETIGNGNYILTQGFQQGHYNITDIETVLVNGMNITVYPNPTTNLIKLEFQAENNSDYNIRLFAVDGKLLNAEKINICNGLHEIDMSKYVVGNYYLEIVSLDNTIRKTCKIVKQ